MKIIQRLAFSILVVLGFANGVKAQNIEDKKMVCMMQDSLQTKPGVPIEHEGKTYYGCCEMCAGKLKAEPEKYTKAKDPVSKVSVDKATAFIYAHKGSIFYFANEGNRSKFSSNPLVYLNSKQS